MKVSGVDWMWYTCSCCRRESKVPKSKGTESQGHQAWDIQSSNSRCCNALPTNPAAGTWCGVGVPGGRLKMGVNPPCVVCLMKLLMVIAFVPGRHLITTLFFCWTKVGNWFLKLVMSIKWPLNVGGPSPSVAGPCLWTISLKYLRVDKASRVSRTQCAATLSIWQLRQRD